MTFKISKPTMAKIHEELYTVSRGIGDYVLENAISINVGELSIRVLVVELLDHRLKPVVEYSVGRVKTLHTSCSIGAALCECVRATPYGSHSYQCKLSSSVVVQCLHKHANKYCGTSNVYSELN